MTDYGHDLEFGAFVTPTAENLPDVLELASLAEVVGFDLLSAVTPAGNEPADGQHQPGHRFLVAANHRHHRSGSVDNAANRCGE